MRLLRVIASIDPKFGGTTEAARTFDAELTRLGHTVSVACLDSPDEKFLKDYPATVHALGPALTGYRFSRLLAPWLRENVHNFDAVLIDGLWQYHGFATWRALSGGRTPYFVFTHGMLDPWFKNAYPRKHLKKWLYWPWAEYRVLRDARAVIFTCEEERRLARQSFWLYKANEVVNTLGIACPPDNGPLLASEFIKKNLELEGKRIVLFLSRLHEKKGCDLLLKAFAEIAKQDSRLHLVMAGPEQGNFGSQLRQEAEQLGIANRITWPGMLRGSEKWAALYAAEVFCLPSHQENFGIVVAEALACARPVLISDKVNIWREVSADSAAFVDTDTVEGTVRNLRRWMGMDGDAYSRMSEFANLCFFQRFQTRQATAKLVELIRTHT